MPPTITGFPRSDGLSRCSTEAKNASRSRCRIDASRRTRPLSPGGPTVAVGGGLLLGSIRSGESHNVSPEVEVVPSLNSRRRSSPRGFAGVCVLLLATVLAGCGQPPWEDGSSASPAPSVRSSAATVSASPSAATTPIHNDLAKGSLKRMLAAGGVELTVNYWSTLDLAAWTPAAATPVNL